jgi:hypothetical protein
MAVHVSLDLMPARMVHTAYLHFVPQLRLALLAPALAAILRAALYAARCAIALAGDLAGVHIAFTLEAGALGVVLGRVCHTRRRGARNLARAHAPC